MDSVYIAIGLFGFGLVINSIIIMVSPKYYSFFSKAYFIESASEAGKEKVKRKIDEEKKDQRYGLSIICIVLGLIAISWSFGMIKSVAFPFLILAIVVFSSAIFGKLKNSK